MAKYYMPTRVFDGKDVIKNHSNDIKKLGKKAFVITGKHSAKANGSLDDIYKVLDDLKIDHVLFDRVEENPSIETVMEARKIGLEKGVDFCIGIGGGSPLDAAKAIALMIYHKDLPADFMYNPSKYVEDEKEKSAHLPILAIPTTCGTGSEVTGVSVLTIHEKKTKGSIKHQIFPDLALIDGKYLKNAPMNIICNTAVDALAHLYESYVCASASDYSKMCVHEGLLVWAKSKDVLLGKREAKKKDYTNLMRAAAFAGMSIAQTGTTIPHALSYSLTYNLHMPHGVAVGYFLPGFLDKCDKEIRKYLLKTAGFKSLKDFVKFYNKVCSEPKVDKKHLEQAFDEVAVNEAKLKSAAFNCNKKALKDIVYFMT